MIYVWFFNRLYAFTDINFCPEKNFENILPTRLFDIFTKWTDQFAVSAHFGRNELIDQKRKNQSQSFSKNNDAFITRKPLSVILLSLGLQVRKNLIRAMCVCVCVTLFTLYLTHNTKRCHRSGACTLQICCCCCFFIFFLLGRITVTGRLNTHLKKIQTYERTYADSIVHDTCGEYPTAGK